MLISVIIAAYNKAFYLERALEGYANQTDVDFEILVADDGSGPQVADAITSFAKTATIPVKHIWHEDKGFRKTVIVNKAIREAKGDYLIFADDDCIPKPNLVAMHRRYAAPTRYIVGAYNRLGPSISQRICVKDVREARVFSFFWLLKNGYRPKGGVVRMLVPQWLGNILDLRGRLDPGRFPGGHSSCWRSDALRIGGFDERMSYGHEDREFGTRLYHAGIRGKRVKNSTYMLHLDHDRPYFQKNSFENNRDYLAETIRDERVKAGHLDS